jgi:hypothetical protein
VLQRSWCFFFLNLTRNLAQMLSPDQITEMKPLAVGIFVWLGGFFYAADRQSKTRKKIRSAFISRLKKDNGGKIDLSAYGQVGAMSFMRNQPEVGKKSFYSVFHSFFSS